VRWRTATPDLDVLPPEEDGGSLPSLPTPTRPATWGRYAALALGAVATVGIVVGASELREQARIARHQECIQDIEVLGLLQPVQNGNPVVIGPAGGLQVQNGNPILQCFHAPIKTPVFLSSVAVPGLVGLRLDNAEQDLKLLGLLGLAKNGPDASNSIVVAQRPTLATSVPVGSNVDLSTRAP
jgi:hypothetical protein